VKQTERAIGIILRMARWNRKSKKELIAIEEKLRDELSALHKETELDGPPVNLCFH
jgi:hypothetical protein